MSRGVYYTMMCTHYGSFTDIERARAIYDETGGDPSGRDWAVTYILTDTLAACEYWNVQSPAPNLWEQLVESDLLVLMPVGTFDPDSGPVLSQSYTEKFANGHYYELPTDDGLLFSPCGLELIDQFLADATQAPDDQCISEMNLAWVLPEE